ncbi:hypothetical protein CONCODRAFT_124376 [Conidiobolus coronatus NRRL 28638]|uniref:Uncharacterized protein n=1 Tax=Conidiobolus coronatus (strain ATCC 28846 / CBS 209.66 / NRRL 28638) TaxID=796925 RepID=A0A137NVD2_CONC2|nr:hypothetical protein CONCODRAFT_124376 [Conidiobolus coronatus NRRL 28638]|eukprot:KXN66746.1 hypothetical protein CONCODRAFT_124376 [Conidiobolus coronatus NRRL 28638]
MSFNNSMTLLNKPQTLCFRKDCDKCLISGKGESTFDSGVDYDYSMQSIQTMQSMQNSIELGAEQNEFSTEQSEFSTETNSSSTYHSNSQSTKKKVRNSSSTRSTKNNQKGGSTITENRYVTNLKQSVLKPIKEKATSLVETKSNGSKKLDVNYTSGSSSSTTTTKSKIFTTISNTLNNTSSSSSSSLKQTFLSFGNGNGGRRESSQNHLIITESPTEAKHASYHNIFYIKDANLYFYRILEAL